MFIYVMSSGKNLMGHSGELAWPAVMGQRAEPLGRFLMVLLLCLVLIKRSLQLGFGWVFKQVTAMAKTLFFNFPFWKPSNIFRKDAAQHLLCLLTLDYVTLKKIIRKNQQIIPCLTDTDIHFNGIQNARQLRRADTHCISIYLELKSLATCSICQGN